MSLKLLQANYDSSDSDIEEDNVQLFQKGQYVNYSGNEKESDENKPLSKEKLPLPSELQNMFKSENNDDDGGEVYGGRIRSFPHVRGNWASFVHIPLNTSEPVIRQLKLLKEVIKDFPDVEFCEDVHLSLSKTLVFRHHWIDSFIDLLKKQFCDFQRFALVFQNFEVYVNDEKTRTFISMNVHPSQHLLQLVKACDIVLSEYDLENYYEDPSFHVSLCWAVGNKASIFTNTILPHLNLGWGKICEEEPELQFCSVENVAFKTGNRICTFPFAKSGLLC